ncbi:Transposon Ty3-G Gag-Pol polyprotein [Labeo rohita]|uniref:ribonuclease H n=1 Tax=Labeo rohita TaxID=84645 RepID=A0ABQ8M1H4_LABRO|nr:Transposon Ty3-G Gag-Pol polyprotein [Labeo rohita]
MLTINQVVSQIRSEDWFVTIDLKDAYFHVSILPQHRKFLRFAFRGEAYQYRVLPFDLALSPRTFTKCVDAALAPLRFWGIRTLNYIDDWLILAQSEHMAVQHRDVVLAHLKELGLRLNAKKSVLSPLQRTTYLGKVWDSTTMQACLSPARIESILTAVTRVTVGRSLTVKQFQRLLGLMAAASNVIPFGLLYMRPLQWWLRTKGFSPRGNPFRMIKVTRQCLRALDMWKKPWFLSQGPVLGAPCRRITLTTDASLTGWGAVMSGHPARGLWSSHHLTWHINCLEMLAVFRALKHFLPDLIGHHVLVRTDNTAAVYYFNHQGGQTPLAESGSCSWASQYGSRHPVEAGLRPGERMLHPKVVKQIWRVFGQAQVDLFATQENAQCPHWFSLTHSAPLGMDAMVQTWPRLRLYAFPLIALLPGVLERVCQDGDRLLLVAQYWPARAWFSDLIPSSTALPGRFLSGGISSRKREAPSFTLARSCGNHQQDPVNCPVGIVLEFLQDRFSAGLAHSTLKVYMAAIAAYHTLLGGPSVGWNPLVTGFLHGALRLRPLTRCSFAVW